MPAGGLRRRIHLGVEHHSILTERTVADPQRIAFLFPGQGSQFVGMGRDLADRFPGAAKRFDLAGGLLGFDLRSVCFSGPEETLKKTRYTQLAIFVHSTVVAEWLAENGLAPSAAAGHSLGELSAYACAGVYPFEHGLRLVAERSRLMHDATSHHPGTMAAIIGLPGSDVEALCREAASAGTVVPANFNAPEQTVVSGSREGVAKAVELAKAKGAKRTVELTVSGGFHSPLMQEAADYFGTFLAGIPLADPRVPVYANVTARPVTAGEDVRTLLVRQLVQPVRWVETIQRMMGEGIRSFIEVGPGKVLTGLVRRIAPDAEIRACGSVEELLAVSKP